MSALLARDPRRPLMLAYVAAGLAFTIAFGLLVVYAFHGIHLRPGNARTKAVADIIGGAAAVLFGLAVLTRRVGAPRGHDAPSARVNWDQRLTIRVAALAGPATHLPGLFYLIALNAIVAYNPRVPDGTLDVLVYNAVWFALPILALALCVVNPAAAQAAVEHVEQWAVRHSRALLLSVSFGVGAALLIRGALAV
jgi:hypothetical protein